MNHGPLIFLGAFATVVSSFWGLVVAPQLQLGGLQPKLTTGGDAVYPSQRPGLAAQGHAVYVANGCVYCHSQQIGQSGVEFDVLLVKGGTNAVKTLARLREVLPALSDDSARQMIATATNTAPQLLAAGLDHATADLLDRNLKPTGAQVQIVQRNLGPDLARHWGRRLSVAQDYLYDDPVQLGTQRIGPDLANFGLRQTNETVILTHLLNPRAVEKNSTMPGYSFLFEQRKLHPGETTPAISLSAAGITQDVDKTTGAPEFFVPKPAARALAAYLMSLQSDAPLFEAPMTAPPPVAATGTNAPAPVK